MKLDTHQLAWAAGILDGEGTIWNQGGQVAVSVANSNVALVMRFHLAIGFIGSVLGPYKPNGFGKKPRYRWTVSSLENAQAVMAMLWKFLSSEKRQKYISVLSSLGRLPVATVLRSPVSVTQPKEQ